MKRELFQDLFEQSAIPIAILEINCKFLYNNQSFNKFIGYSITELQKRTCHDLIDSNYIEVKTKNINKLLNGEVESFQMEVKYVHKDGFNIWGLLTASIINNKMDKQRYILVQVLDITKSKQMEEQLQVNEKQYRLLAENSSDIISTYKLDRLCQYVSPSIERRLGYKPYELIGKDPMQLIHPEDVQHVLVNLKIFQNTPITKTFIHRLLHKKGHYLWFETNIKCIFENEIPLYFLTTSRGISRRMEMIKELNNTNARMNNILESITDGFIALDNQDQIIYVNQAAEKIINKKRYEVLNKHWFEVYPSGVNYKLEEHYKIVKETQIPICFETYFKLLNAWYSIRLYPTRSGIAMYFLDITKQKKLESELQESEERYRTLVESSPEAISVAVDNKFVYMNPAGLKLLGASHADEVIGKPVWDFFPEEEHALVKKEMEKIFSDKNMTSNIIHTNLKVDGTPITVSATSRVVNYNGKKAVQAIVHDITERRKLEEGMQKSEKLSLVGQLAAGVAHEVRNPLTSVKGFIQLAKITNELKPSFLDIIISELDRTEAIIYEFLSLAKPSEQSLFELTEVTQLLNTVIPLLETQALMCNVSIKTEMRKKYYIICDPNQLKQVFSNLIKNSIEASYYNGEITISIRDYDEENVVISVEDEGCGIPKDKISKLGEPFFTTKENGTGLGLLITYKIIESHNGKLTISSIEGKGTTIDVILPKAEAPKELTYSNYKENPDAK